MSTTKKRATLKDVAREAGIHVSTVSRILNGSPGEIDRAASPSTIQAVQAIATSLGYTRNQIAVNLRASRSGLIAVLVPRLSDLVLANIYEGIESAATDLGLAAFVMNTYDDMQRQASCLQAAKIRQVDGIIFGDANFNGQYLREVANDGIPFVLVSRRSPNFPSVSCDDKLGGRLVAEHFLERGHTKVGILAGREYTSTGMDRTLGFAERYREAGIDLTPRTIVHNGYDVEGGRVGTMAILRTQPDTTAIFATNDFSAIGAMGVARDAGRSLGNNFAVAGFNDTSVASELPIPLTSVRSPMHTMGYRSAELLNLAINGGTPGQEILAPKLYIRSSSSFRVA